MNEAEQREEAVFEAALQLPADQRSAYLDQTCAGDVDLRRRVEVLLGAFERASAFMKEPAIATLAPTVSFSLPPSEKPGDRIGHYKLLEQIGEGGCGVVYVAEQEEPVRRRVALKVIKLGMDTKQVMARFDAERQALAMMDHPNIAKVLDAGASETGRPYFVMELVRGTKITDYCGQHQLAPRKRLDLFIQVCRAIQHAHQKGVIHRDIKPSNILVTLHDSVPVPKVIDFGIAKATQGRLTDQTVYTAFEQFIGTPAYMSPEQAELSGLDIDTRSDIYSLGVLLYELLTGKTPFDAKDLLSKGLHEMRRTIREVEPVKPSTRLTKERTGSGSSVKSAIRNPQSAIADDLDWIVMKCLEKDRARRYETANGLAADVSRHLNNEPVVARPPGRLYRFQKTVQRNKLALGAAAAVALALVIGSVGSTVMFFKAQAEKKKAQTESTKNQQTAQFLKAMLNGVSPWVALGRDTTLLRDILDKTAERVGNDFTNQPSVEAEMRQTLGGVYFSLGLYEKAEAMQRQALAIRRKVFGNEHPDVASSLLGLGVALDYRGRRAEAEPLVREGLAMRRKFLGPEHEQVAEALDILVKTLRNEGKLAEAETLAREYLTLQRKRFGKEHSEVGESLYSLGRILAYEEKWVEAEATLREALAMQREFLGDDHPEIGWTLGTLARVFRDQGRLVEAEAVQREAVATLRRVLGNQHSSVGSAFCELARIVENQGRFGEAEDLFREALASKRAGAYIGLMDVLHKEGKRDEEEAMYRQALAEVPKETGDESDLAMLFDLLARRVDRIGRQAEAEKLSRDALAIRRRLLGSEHSDVAASLDFLAQILLKDSQPVSNPDKQSKLAEAEQHVREALAMRRKLLSSDDPAILNSLQSLASILNQEGKLAEAEQFYREALASVRKSVGKDPSKWTGLITRLADVLRRQNKTDAIEELFSDVLTPSVEQQPASVRVVAARAEFFSRCGRWQQAVTDAARLVQLEPTNHLHYHWLSSLLVQIGDVDGYRKNCQQALARFRGTDHPNVAERMAKDCLILAESGVDLVAVGAWADMALSRGKDSRDLPWFQFVKGLAEYRQGHFGEAQEWTQKVLNPSAQSDNRNVEAGAVLAMAQFKLNQNGAARLTLAKASQMEAQLPVARQDLGANWIDWIIAHALLREAKALIEGEAPPRATIEKKTPPR